MNEKRNVLKEKSFDFAVQSIYLYKELAERKKEYVLSKQLLRSGTSIGANVREAQNAQSDSDFIYKLYVSQKECDETLYWLELLKETDFISEESFTKLHKEADEILKILKSSILTVKQRIQRTK
ncbi:MAG: four helix bundle protein [Anditalea sp.]